jgi:hypothetical protein
MADTKITALTEDTTPTSDDLLVTVNDAGGTPANRKVTATNLVTKAHGLSDGLVKVATGTMAVASAGTDYSTPSSSDVLTNKTFDANGTGNSLSNVEVADLAATAVVTAAEGLSSSDNDTSIPTTAAVIDGLDTKAATSHTHELADLDATGASDGHVLTADGAGGAAWEASAAGGGISSYDYVIAASGGDYTSIAAWFAATPTAGDVLLIRDTVTEPSSTTVTTANISIYGENIQTSVIAVGTNTLTFSGADVLQENVQYTASTGMVYATGTNAIARGVYWNISGVPSNSNGGIRFTNADALVIGCRYENSTTTTATAPFLGFAGARARFIGNSIYANANDTTSTRGVVVFDSYGGICSNNTFRGRGSNASSAYVLNIRGQNCTVTDNVFQDFNVTNNLPALVGFIGTYGNFSGNTLYHTYLFANSTSTIYSDNQIYLANANNTYAILTDSSCDLCTFTGNVIYTAGGTTTRGILFQSGAIGNRVLGNTFVNWVTGISGTAGNNTDMIITNNSFSNVTTPVSLSQHDYQASNNFPQNPTDERILLEVDNDSGSTLAAGAVVVWGTAADGKGVTTTTTAGDPRVAGVNMISSTAGDTQPMLKRGKTTLLKVDGTTDIAVGDFLSTFTTAGIAAKASVGHTVFAIALEAYSGNDSNGVIDALLIEPRVM